MSMALRFYYFLSGLFLGVGIRLVDFKLEFGRLWEDDQMRIVLADEISPDSCRLWDMKTNEKWTRTASAGTSATSRKPIRKWPAAWASCRKAVPRISRARRSCNKGGEA